MTANLSVMVCNRRTLYYYSFVLIVITCYTSFGLEMNDLEPEGLQRIDLRGCIPGGLGRASSSSGYIHLPEESELNWCLNLTTSNNHYYPKQSTASSATNIDYTDLKSRVYVTYRELLLDDRFVANEEPGEESAATCSLTFRGQSGPLYRLSPDYGSYPGCQQLYSAQRQAIATNTASRQPAPSPACPLLGIPQTRVGHEACQLRYNRWYELRLRSVLSYELRNHSRIQVERSYYKLFNTRTRTEYSDPDHLLRLHVINRGCHPRALVTRSSQPIYPFPVRFKLACQTVPDYSEEENGKGEQSFEPITTNGGAHQGDFEQENPRHSQTDVVQNDEMVENEFEYYGEMDEGIDWEEIRLPRAVNATTLCLNELSTDIGNETFRLDYLQCYHVSPPACDTATHPSTDSALILIITALLIAYLS